MSGIVGIFNRSGAPVDRGLLRALTYFLAYRGPDAQESWSHDSIGFGHTLLHTTRESLNELQPASLDGRFWITADARIDCRAELRTKLEGLGRKQPRTITDPELILHAYAAWKEECVQHLRGDFSFAIWDIRDKKLFCARDHFGIKPFYYAEIGSTFIFSNTLNCVRVHPSVPDELNDAAILDFLLVGLNCDNATTTFRDVKRLPPAHYVAISSGRISRPALLGGANRRTNSISQRSRLRGALPGAVARSGRGQAAHEPGGHLPERRTGFLLDRGYGAALDGRKF